MRIGMKLHPWYVRSQKGGRITKTIEDEGIMKEGRKKNALHALNKRNANQKS